MPKFNYLALDAAGKETRGSVEASSKAQAIQQINSMNLFPTKVVPASGADVVPGAGAPAKAKKGMNMEIKLPKFFKKSVKTKDLTVFTRQIATLMDAGLPLLRSIRVLERQAQHPTLKEVLHEMGESVESGNSFSEALANHPKIFDNLYVNMVKAGEAGGVTEVVLNRLSEFMEKAEKIKGKVKSAMIYPVVILVAALGITTFLMLTVIPKFEEIFRDLLEGKGLPPITQFVIAASNLVKNNAIMCGLVLAAIIILFNLWSATKAGKVVLDRIKIRIPVFGTLTRRTCISRLTRTLGTLLASGVPMLQALAIVRDTSGNVVFAQALQKVHDGVKEGENMSGLMDQTKVFPPMVISMIDVGEETGAISDMLTRIADTYEEEVDNAVSGLTSILEPMMILFLAVVVGTIVIAMFLPLVSIISTMGGQGA